MQLKFSESQTMLQDTVARLFADEVTSARLREAEASGLDKALWDQLVALGIVGMRALAPEDGGMSLMDAAIVAEQMGRHVAPVPLVEAIVATALLHRAKAPRALLDAVEGGAVATVALSPAATGRPLPVLGGSVAHVIVALVGGDLVALVGAAGERARNIADATVAMIDVAVAEEHHVLASGSEAEALYNAALEEWRVLTAAALAGLGRRALELAAAYSGERIAYGVPIGSFQGIAHPMADAAINMDGAKLLTWRAISSIAAGQERAGARAAMAYWWAAHSVDQAVKHAVRTFGGYGVSLEYDVQIYFRRAKLHALIAGDPNEQLDRIAARLWDGEAAALPSAGDVGIDFEWGERAEAYAAEVRAFVEANITDDVRAKMHHSTSGFHAGFHKKMAEAGFAYPDMALDGKPRLSRYEVMAAAPMWEDMGWTRTPSSVTEFVAGMAQLWAQPDVKQEIVGAVLAGDALGALGFSEPQSGSDIFGAKFSAVRDGDEWVLNGQKMFTTNGHQAHYILMLTRTDNSGKKHQGLTMFIVPMNLPGIELHPVYTLQDEKTNITYFTDVRVPDRYRIGEVNDGARVMTSGLSFEHGGSGYHAAQKAMVRRAVDWARKMGPDGSRPIEDANMRRILARAAVRDEVADVLCRRQEWAGVEGVHEIAWGPMAKLFTTEMLYVDGSAIIEAAAPYSLVRGLDRDLDIVEVSMRRGIAMTIYGGTSEVHRSLIAEKSLGMPKSR
ncbi:acyl-CoA dehydrogenase [Sphingobium baderi]|uniref:acyl-CoA dehydrogenase n=1 Tax=Sphingobium baderi TaxID=1332080 RepID=UPI002B4159FA|nr:acyl-CoA dehydrogenase [Sphingobium baderi]WRD75496.1 acyl-CoA dehydrogenase [Sphingobium baderi]